jgi:Ca-activated chloride channel homolog
VLSRLTPNSRCANGTSLGWRKARGEEEARPGLKVLSIGGDTDARKPGLCETRPHIIDAALREHETRLARDRQIFTQPVIKSRLESIGITKSQSIARYFVLFLLVGVAGWALRSQIYVQSGRNQQSPPSSRGERQSTKNSNKDKEEKASDRPLADNSSVQIDEDGTIKMDTSLVTIPVTVVDRNGKFVPFLTRRDFRLYEDGVLQEIEIFDSVETPFHVALVLDTSGSTRFKLDEIQKAAFAFVNLLRPDDQVMVVSFDARIRFHCDFTSDYDELRRAIYETRTGGSTRLYEAVDEVVDRVEKIQGRKAIVLFTDGVDTSSRTATYQSTIEKVEESGVLTYTIKYDTEMDNPLGIPNGPQNPWPPWPFPSPFPRGRRWPFNPSISYQFPQWPRRPPAGGGTMGDYTRATRYLQELADRSGGRLYNADTISNVSQAFSMIAEELRQQYSLGYYPSNMEKDGTYRRVKVSVGKSGMIVRARQGYRAAVDTQAKTDQVENNRPELKRKQLAEQ